MLNRTFKSFRYADFRLMWMGACTSSIGTWMQKAAQSWMLLQLSNSPFLLGLDAFLGEIPILLFSLVGGVVADRYDRRRLLIGSQLVQMSCAFTLAALFATGAVQIWMILGLSFVTGLAQAFGGPAYQALVPTLVTKEDLPNAIALNSIQFNVARVVGPALGGLALTSLGAAWCFSLNGISFVAVIITLLLIKTGFIPAKATVSMLASMKDGIAFIRGKPDMVSLIILAFGMTSLGIPLMTFLPVFAKDVLKGDADTYTLLLSISGLGSILGALFVASTGTSRRKGFIALSMMIVLGFSVMGFAVSKSFWASAALAFVGGAALIACFALIASLVQLIVTDDMRGRVMSVYNVAFRGGMPLGSLAAGSLIPAFTAPVVLACNGVLLAALGAWFLLVQKRVARL